MMVAMQCCVNSTSQNAFEKVLTRKQGLFWGGIFYPELYLDPGSCGGNTPSTSPKSLVPGGLRWKHTEYQPKIPSSWGPAVETHRVPAQSP